jgi:hypothetical protein
VPLDGANRGPSEVASTLRLDDVIFVSGVRREEQGIAVAVGTVADPVGAPSGEGTAWIGFRYDAATGSDAFWTVPANGSPSVRLAGAARVWLCSDGRAFLAGPVSQGTG